MKKVPAIKKIGKLQKLNTIQLLGYADMAHSSMNEVFAKGKDLFNEQYLGHISAEDNAPNLDKIQKILDEYAEAHNAIVVELGNRFKEDLKLSKAPIQITKVFEDIKKEFPALGQYESKQLHHMAQEKTAKDRAEANKLQREREAEEAKAKKPEAPKGKVAKKKEPKLKAVKNS